ncbi:retrovirus-related pol polyprotein from transposon TNT 1-94 [Tanacetum coccineum]
MPRPRIILLKEMTKATEKTRNQKLCQGSGSDQRYALESTVIFGSNLRGNIIGKGQICDNKCRVTFSEHDSEITKDGKVIGRGIRKKGLYVMKLGNKPKDQICLTTIDENSTLWHRRLGHANMRLIQSLASKELVRNLPKLKFDQHFCDACKIGKQAHASHKAKNVVSTTRCLELLHMDLFSPSAVRSYGGNRYTLVIVDDYSRKDISHYCPGVLGGDTCEGYIFITARVFLEATPAMGTYGFHYCPGVLEEDTYDGYIVHRFHELRTEYHNPPSIALALSRAPPVVEFYSGDIVSRRVLTLCIPSPLLGLLLLWLLLLGPRAVPACTTLSNSHKIRNDILESQKCSSYHASLSTLESHIASLEAEKARLEAVEVSLRKEVNDVKRDRIEVVSKVVPYAAMELIYSDDMGSLVGRLISSAIFYGRCKAFEQVAEMKEPFDLSKVKG